MKITAIKRQVKHPGRVSIYVDDVFAFGLSEAGVLDLELYIGRECSEEELAHFKSAAQIDKTYGRVLNLIARRPRSIWEVETYLHRKGYEKTDTAAVVSKLQEKGYLDDQEFARRWVESRRLLKPMSRRKLALELKQKRVSEAIIQDVLTADDTDELAVLRQEIVKKRRLTRYKDETKLMAYLARQGYQYGDIRQALESIE